MQMHHHVNVDRVEQLTESHHMVAGGAGGRLIRAWWRYGR